MLIFVSRSPTHADTQIIYRYLMVKSIIFLHFVWVSVSIVTPYLSFTTITPPAKPAMVSSTETSVSARQGNQYEIDTFDNATYSCSELVVLRLAFSRCSGKSTTRTLSSSVRFVIVRYYSFLLTISGVS